MQFCNLKNKKTPILAQIGCFGGQIFQTRPNFIDLGALVCDSYPSINIPKNSENWPGNPGTGMHVYQPQDHNIVR